VTLQLLPQLVGLQQAAEPLVGVGGAPVWLLVCVQPWLLAGLPAGAADGLMGGMGRNVRSVGSVYNRPMTALTLIVSGNVLAVACLGCCICLLQYDLDTFVHICVRVPPCSCSTAAMLCDWFSAMACQLCLHNYVVCFCNSESFFGACTE
jgi:hypothetical protein